MIDIPKIYNEYLQRKNVENRKKYKKYKGFQLVAQVVVIENNYIEDKT